MESEEINQKKGRLGGTRFELWICFVYFRPLCTDLPLVSVLKRLAVSSRFSFRLSRPAKHLRLYNLTSKHYYTYFLHLS